MRKLVDEGIFCGVRTASRFYVWQTEKCTDDAESSSAGLSRRGRINLFSVIIPSYNSASLLLRAVRSVLAQDGDYELIVVDDGSTDDTAAALKPFGEAVRYLYQANAGPGSARNLALAHAKGDYTVFLDSDDALTPWALKTYANIIAEHRPAFILSRPFRFERDASLKALRPGPLELRVWQDYLDAASARYPVTMAAAFNTDVLRRHGGFNAFNATSEDQDLYLRLGEEEGFVFVESPYLYAYRVNANSRTANVSALYAGLERLLEGEAEKRYPGGASQRAERSLILKRIIRYKLRRCLKDGRYSAGYGIYLRSLPYLLRTDHKFAYELLALLLRAGKNRAQRTLEKLGHSAPSNKPG